MFWGVKSYVWIFIYMGARRAHNPLRCSWIDCILRPKPNTLGWTGDMRFGADSRYYIAKLRQKSEVLHLWHIF